MPEQWYLQSVNDVTLSVSERGDPSAAATVIAHGAGSSADFALRVFAPLPGRLVAYDLRGHGNSTPIRDESLLRMDAHVADLAAVVTAVSARTVAGLSLGGHAVACWAADRDLDAVLIGMPGWLGPPDAVAGANARQAAELAELGTEGSLRRIRRHAPAWVVDELEASWRRHDPAALQAVLRTLARSPAPSVDMLRAVRAPAAVVALADDPLHPVGVARRWARALPRGAYGEVTLDEMAHDRGALGRAAAAALAGVAVTWSP